MDFDIRQRLELALQAASQGAAIALDHFNRASLRVDRKSDGTPVTAADRECEAHIRAMLARHAPDDGFLGEESGEAPARSGWTWILDPVDGTKSFIHGVPLWGTLLAAEHAGEVRIGVVALPAMGESIYASAGGGAWHLMGNQPPRPARVSDATLRDGPVCFTALESFDAAGRADVLARLRERCPILRGWSDAYSQVLVATGRAVAAVEPALSSWDIAPMAVILREAGGTLFDFGGRTTIHGGSAVSVNSRAADELLAIVRPAG